MKHICSKSKFAANRCAVNLKSWFIVLCYLCYFVCIGIVTVKPQIQIYRAPIYLKPRF